MLLNDVISCQKNVDQYIIHALKIYYECFIYFLTYNITKNMIESFSSNLVAID